MNINPMDEESHLQPFWVPVLVIWLRGNVGWISWAANSYTLETRFFAISDKKEKRENFAEDFSFWKKNENDIVQLFSTIL